MVIFDFLASRSAWTTVLAAKNLGWGRIHHLPLSAVPNVGNRTKIDFSSSFTVHKTWVMWKNVLKSVFVRLWAISKKSFFFPLQIGKFTCRYLQFFHEFLEVNRACWSKNLKSLLFLCFLVLQAFQSSHSNGKLRRIRFWHQISVSMTYKKDSRKKTCPKKCPPPHPDQFLFFFWGKRGLFSKFG